jgi:hypothetical protein
VNRQDIGSWLLGPKATLENQGMDFGYPGGRLGMPQAGPGAVATFGRRMLALCADWFACLAISHAILRGPAVTSNEVSVLTMELFAAEVIGFTLLLGGSFGQSLFGIGIRNVTGQRLGILATAVRTGLLCLVFPALIWDRDGRGLHDQITRSAVVRTR